MSIQQSLHFEPEINPREWQQLLELADVLSSQYSLPSLLDYICKVIEENYACQISIWLDNTKLKFDKRDLPDHRVLTNKLSALMEKAWRECRIAHNDQGDDTQRDGPLSIAIPLIAREQPLGVIQLNQTLPPAKATQDIYTNVEFISQISLAIYELGHHTHSEFLQRKIALLTAIEEISKSILSNLIWESLLNSTLSIIHLMFHFPRVMLLIAHQEGNHAFRKAEIAQDGIKIEPWYQFKDEADPVVRSVSNLKPVIINNVSLDERFGTFVFGNNIRSELIFPLLNGAKLMGALVLISDAVDAFGPDSIMGFQLLAQSISLAIRNAQVRHSEQARRLVHDDLQRLFGAISSEVTLNDVLQNLLDELEKILPWDAAAVWLLDNTANKSGIDQFISTLHLTAIRTNKKNIVDLAQSQGIRDVNLVDQYLQNIEGYDGILSSKYQWIKEILTSSAPKIKNAASTFEPLGEIFDFKSEYSAIGAPLLLDNQPLGIIILIHHLSNQYDMETHSILEVISRYAAITIENMKLYAAAHDQAWVSTVLFQVAEATQSLTNVDELLHTVVDILPELIGVDACLIYLWDQSVEALLPQASSGFDDEQTTCLNEWNISPGSVPAFDDLVKNNLPVILDSDTIPKNIISEVFSEHDFERDLLILFPLSSQSEIGGAILIDFTNSTLQRDSSQEIWDEKYTLIQGAARQTAIALENLQLIKSQEEDAYVSIALLQVAQAIVSLNQLDEILGSIVRITPILAGVKRCIIYLWESEEQAFRQSQSYGISKDDLILVGQEINGDSFPFINAIQKHNQIIYHTLRSEDSPANWNEIITGDYQIVEGVIDESEDISIKLDVQSLITRERLLIGFPLSVKGEILGVMLIEEEGSTKGFPSPHIREKRIEIIKGITQQAAIAIKNELLQQEAVKSESMERELQLAREIQSTFLPEKLPEIPGWEIAASWQPARQVGGDFYDILLLDEDHVGIVIADVADKGMPAALFMTLIRTLIRAAVKDKSSPAAVLKQVNTLLIPDSKHGMFVTVFYAVFSLASGKMIYANAGHNPPIVKQDSEDELKELTRTSIALGLFDDIDVDEREITLKAGDWILFYTDGVTEAFSASDEMFSVERLLRILKETKFVSSRVLVNKIEQSVNEFISGTDLSDDLTLAVVYRKPE